MKIRGKVTRVVEAQGGTAGRVFFRPEDPEVYRKIDGDKFCASGEIPVAVDDTGDHKVDDEVEFDVEGTDDEEEAPAPRRVRKPHSPPAID